MKKGWILAVLMSLVLMKSTLLFGSEHNTEIDLNFWIDVLNKLLPIATFAFGILIKPIWDLLVKKKEEEKLAKKIFLDIIEKKYGEDKGLNTPYKYEIWKRRFSKCSYQKKMSKKEESILNFCEKSRVGDLNKYLKEIF